MKKQGNFLSRFAQNSWERMCRKKYLENFRPEVLQVAGPRVEHVMTRVKIEARKYYLKHLPEIPDPQGFATLSLACLVLASYRELLSAGVDEKVAFEAIRRAYVSTYGTAMSKGTKLFLRFVPDPVEYLRKKSLVPFFDGMFGKWFTYQDERQGDNYTLVVARCGFHEFFRDEGEPQLTRLMCSMDRNWLAAFDTSDRPVATRRTITLSTGGHRCEFHFDRAEAGPAPTVDVTL